VALSERRAGRCRVNRVSDRSGEFGERCSNSLGWVRVDSEFVMTTAEILNECDSSDDDLRGAFVKHESIPRHHRPFDPAELNGPARAWHRSDRPAAVHKRTGRVDLARAVRARLGDRVEHLSRCDPACAVGAVTSR
jgi:hypothetical protein